jgi:LPS sulfotransferase NodH
VTIDERLARPVFIVGAPRSGTSWLQKLLLEHPDCCGSQETHFFRAFGPAIKTYDDTARSHRGAGLHFFWNEKDLFDRLTEMWVRTQEDTVKDSPESRLLVEKTPDHSFWVRQIVRLLPESRFVFVARDSRAVACSLVAASATEWGAHWAPSDLVDAAKWWKAYVKAAHLALSDLPDDCWITVHYEDLLEDTAGQLARVLAFVGVEATAAQIADAVERNSFAAARAAEGADAEPRGFLRAGSSDSWKKELTILEKRKLWKTTKRYMRILGYDECGGRARPAP